MSNSLDKNEIKLYHFESFQSFKNIEHYISTRQGGHSIGAYDSLNLGKNTKDNPENFLKNRLALAEKLVSEVDKMTFPQQTHSGNVKVLNEHFFNSTTQEQDDFLRETDAIITNVKKQWINVLAADCVPILLYDSEKEVVAAIHAGWRSCVQGILQNTIDLMIRTFQSKPKSIKMGIGPSISQKNYEVGEEVVSSFKDAFPQFHEQIFSNFKTDRKAHLDLWTANKLQAIEKGIPDSNIEVLGICTYENHDTFFSSRFDKGITGRFATGIKLN
ncbi:peptidoglycan editing factor PgeF [Sediminitomix flava]|uniref:Purine nucleoside phosphorylase n=1 Tax=Sediminitomix flava TaxID=379075 RepID=A0A315Z953_SEDFL|nr:peptidoglycan editing factor PgeF [Sediminitomix flava]PWJ41822.1 hypothetical protein BC781_10372 [Sediminitomix flava]